MSIVSKNEQMYVMLKDGSGNVLSSTGGALDVGATFSGDVTSATADNFLVNANIQVGDADVAYGQGLMNASLPVCIASDQSTLNVDGSGVTQPVSAVSLPLPTGAATEASISSIDGKITACNTGAVVVSSQPALTNSDVVSAEVTLVPVVGSQANLWNAATPGLATGSTAVDCQYVSKLSIFGSNTTDTNTLDVQYSQDNSNFYNSGVQITLGPGDFNVDIPSCGARYVRLYNGGAGFSGTITATVAGKQ